MFTSNGLMCLRGVTIWRMCLSAMHRLPRYLCFRRIDRRMSGNLRSAVEPTTDKYVYTTACRMSSRVFEHLVRRLRRGREGVAGWAPRTLSDSDRSVAREHVERSGNVGTGEAVTALRRREVIAGSRLQFGNRRSEGRQVAFGNRRQDPHDQQATEMGGLVRGSGHKAVEGRRLVDAVHALPMLIEHDENAPPLGKRHVGDDRRRPGRGPSSAIDHQAAAVE